MDHGFWSLPNLVQLVYSRSEAKMGVDHQIDGDSVVELRWTWITNQCDPVIELRCTRLMKPRQSTRKDDTTKA